ncbi:MAG TPA: ATP-binding cassette domain-containing protein [Steroidobacteraceae bacterium]|nr:ATP-binding cassette domain-containing protein [Steroidobacteraceae bacterium]
MPVPARTASRLVAIELAAVHLGLGGRAILRDVHWRIRPGERWVLMGANGAGKTQLLKLLAGDVWPAPRRQTRRIYRWRGEDHDEPYGVKQEIAYVGAERQDRYQHYEWNQRVLNVVGSGWQRHDQLLDPLSATDRGVLRRLLARVGIAELAARRFLTLSYGQRRLVLLARALAWKPGLLLLDELSNGLDPHNRALVQRLIHGLRRRRLPWVLATHRSEEIPASATHLALLERGRLTWQGRIGAARRAGILPPAPRVRGGSAVRQAREAPGVRREPGAVSARRRRPAATGAAAGGRAWFELKNAWVWRDGKAVLRELAFKVMPGQCWVVHGANGSGKSTLLRAMYGDLGVASQGEIKRRGIEAGIAISQFKRRVGFIAPELQTSHPLYLTAVEVVVSGLHSSLGLDGTPSAAERRRALAALRVFGAAALAQRTLRQLSYGQLRRVLFARAWVHKPDILLLDEPYTGLDAATRRLLQQRVEAWAAAGGTLVMVTHHRDEWPAAATHELHLVRGAARYCGEI